jgi:hypothetical protein
MFIDFINQYGLAIAYAVVMGLVGYLGIVAKRYCEKWFNTREKKAVAKTVVQAVEQIYKDLHGEEKLDAALTAAEEMLAEKGITFSRLEMRMLIEAAVAEFNGAFHKAEPATE